MCPLIIHGQTIREWRVVSYQIFFFPLWNCRILIAAGEGKSTLLFTSILFSAFSIFVLMDHLTKPFFTSCRQSCRQARVISNRLDIFPNQHPLWENIPILGPAPIILYFLHADDGWHLGWQVKTLCSPIPGPGQILKILDTLSPIHPFSHPSEAGCEVDGDRQRATSSACKKALSISSSVNSDMNKTVRKWITGSFVKSNLLENIYCHKSSFLETNVIWGSVMWPKWLFFDDEVVRLIKCYFINDAL